MDSIPHGTYSGYSYHRCRCDECRAVKSARKREYAAERRAAGVICKVDGCHKVVSGADPQCSAHKAQIGTHGSVVSVETRTNDGVARCYSTAHGRLRLVRGQAGEYPCVDCRQPAEGWSLRRDASFRQTDTRSNRKGLVFSPDPYDYEPRCGSCHAAYDGYGGRVDAPRDQLGRLCAAVRDPEEP